MRTARRRTRSVAPAVAAVAALASPPLPAAATAEPPAPVAAACRTTAQAYPGGAAGGLVAAAAGLDCRGGAWTFELAGEGAGRAELFVDADRRAATGCLGYDLVVAVGEGGRRADAWAMASCDPSRRAPAGPVRAGPGDAGTVRVAVPATVLGATRALRWWAGAGTAEAVPPADGDGPVAEAAAPDPRPAGAARRWYAVVAPASLPAAQDALARAGLTHIRPQGGGVVGFAGDPLAAATALAATGAAAAVTPDDAGAYEEVPNDPGFASQWGLRAVRADAAWDRTHGSPNVVVAVVDSGVDATHPDLAGKLVPGWDATRGEALPGGNSDPSGHGTAVAGVVAAATGNGGGLASVGWDTRVAMVKDGDGTPSRSATVAGIRWAADNGARVINVSSSYVAPDPNEVDAVAYARARGSVVVAAAGDGAGAGNPPLYPAAVDGVLAVGATSFDGVRAGYSTVADYVDLVAPGGTGDGDPAHEIHVLVPGGGTGFRSGTSYSAPLAAGAIALLVGARPLQPTADAVAHVVASARDLGAPGRDPEYGAGLLDVDAALAAAGVPVRPPPPPPPPPGYRLVASDGGVFAFGGAAFLGSTGALRLAQPIVGAAATRSGGGYWLVASDGGVFAFGDAPFVGSTGALRLARPIVAMVATPSGRGYWLVASDGGVFAFGDAAFLGSAGALPLARPIVGAASTPSGRGYWLVASDGGVFAFGDAPFVGSTGALPLARPIVGMAATSSGRGYRLVASDGGVFAFGDATFLGSTGALPLARPIVGMAATSSGRGYRLVASDGGVFAFGDAPFLGSTGALALAQPIVGMATSGH